MPSFHQEAASSQQPNTAALNRTLFIKDNLLVLRGIDSESVDLIATDPPFNKGVKAFEGIVTAGTDRKGKKVSYKDVWTWGDVQNEWTQTIKDDHPKLYAVIQAANAAAGEDMGAFLCWLGVRVLEMHRILKPTGSFYLHLDHTAGAWGKAMLDAIFGRDNFRNEIVWDYRKISNAAGKKFSRAHDTILFYSKTKAITFNALFDDALSPRKQQLVMQGWNTKNMDGDRYLYVYDQNKVDRAIAQGRLDMSRFDIVRTVDTSRGNRITDVFAIDFLNSQSKENTKYPTQKPLALYRRIIEASSNKGDMVLDPFAGCATTCVAAEQLERQWIGIDVNKPAKDVLLERLEAEVQASMAWNDEVQVYTKPPERTDDGKEAAPELTLVSPRPKAPRLTARELRARLILADGMMCQGCGWIPHHEEYLEVDHRVPKSREGPDSLRNRVLLCSPCNGAKGNKLTLAELRLRRIEEGRMAQKAWTRDWYERTGRFG